MKLGFLFIPVLILSGCSEKAPETPTPLPKLQAIEAPKTLAGTYVGRLPCEDCDEIRITMVLDSSGNANIQEIYRRDSAVTLQSVATYQDSLGVIKIRFVHSNRTLHFRNKGGFSIVLLDYTGKEYVEESLEPYQLIRILNKPVAAP